ncbi:MAG: SpoIIE family protein phosphatase, partial [Verrucomicrobiae bacterium]|nr:SpoIIE family protein phosphatase [Verrucomicrobiae bacterium]
MNLRGLGLQGKFVTALLVAAALPFVLGLLVLETLGYRHLLAERGRLHEMEALTLVNALDQSAKSQASQMRTWLAADPTVGRFLEGIGRANAARSDSELAAETRQLDETWKSLTLNDPKVLAVIDNTAAGSLRAYQNLHPEIAEILLTDGRGRLVAATGKSSDIEQADEAWWHEGAALKPGEYWTDVLRFDASAGVFSVDLVVPILQDTGLAGVIKISEDVSTLFGRLSFDGEAMGERWQIVLADGRVLASSKSGYKSLESSVHEPFLNTLRRQHRGWAIAGDELNEERMMGFVALDNEGEEPSAYVVFSSLRDDVVAPLQRNFLWLGVAGAALFASCTFIGFLLVRRNILMPLASLGQAARSISATARLHHAHAQDQFTAESERRKAEADLETIQAIHTGDEVESLADDLAVMTSRVLRYHRELEAEVAAKTSVIREDLEMARQFQQALLPTNYPLVPPDDIDNPLRLAFAHFYQPASTVGGDFFDVIELDENRAGILIADVMGHGARSALVTAILRALVRNLSAETSDPGDFLSELNHHLHDVISRSGQTLFVTAFLLVLDTREGSATWSVAGHPSPLRVRRGSGKKPEPLWTEPQHQPALGLLPDAAFRTERSNLGAGDVFLLFTDGVFEAENPDGQPFGPERLAHSFDDALDGPMAAMPAKIV